MKQHPANDQDWQSLSQAVIAHALGDSSPKNIIIVFIKGWFDVKWYRFSGKCMGSFGLWKSRLTIPPFHPSRVLVEAHFKLDGSGAFYQCVIPQRNIHGFRSSEQNMRMYVEDVCPDTDLFWISSPSTERLSIMHYSSHELEAHGWFLEFHRTATWQLNRHRGLTTVETTRLLPMNPARSLQQPRDDESPPNLKGVSEAWRALNQSISHPANPLILSKETP